MHEKSEPYTLLENGWIVRIQPPIKPTPGPLKMAVALHGWTGDENSMSVFIRQLPPNYWVFSPRAPLPAHPKTGYSWVNSVNGRTPSYPDFIPVTDALAVQIEHWQNMVGLPGQPVDLLGFSQGGAMTYTLLTRIAHRVNKAAVLAGYLPRGGDPFLSASDLGGKEVFIFHGTQDETVPYTDALLALEALRQTNAVVQHCSDEVGHKLGFSCLKALEEFFQADTSAPL